MQAAVAITLNEPPLWVEPCGSIAVARMAALGAQEIKAHSFGVTAFPRTSVIGRQLTLANVSSAFMDHLWLQLRAPIRD